MTRDTWDDLILRHLDGESSVEESADVTRQLSEDGDFRLRFFTFVHQVARFRDLLANGEIAGLTNGVVPSESDMASIQRTVPKAIPVGKMAPDGTPVARVVPNNVPISKPAVPPPGMETFTPVEEPQPGLGRRILALPWVIFRGLLRLFFRQSFKRQLLILGGLAVLFFLGWVLGPFASTSLSSKELDAALIALKQKQRDWWDNEGLTNQGSKDPAGALARLQKKQRDWWESEQLTARGDKQGDKALAKLEEMQRGWWDSEGLANGQPSKDPAGALARLDKLNRQWLNGQKIGRAKEQAGPTEPDDPEGNPDTPQTPAELADLKVKLLDKAGTRRFLDAGGTPESEEAVQLGLQWLAVQQQPDGSWIIDPHHPQYHRGATNVSATAFALLPFLARGETHKGSQDINTYTKQVERGIDYLIKMQQKDGRLPGGDGMYTHAVATIALCEDLGMTNDPKLRGPAQRAIDYILFSQDPNGGGWRYGPKQPGDLSVTSWALMALKSGQMAGLNVPREALEKATKYLDHVNGADGRYGYTSPQGDGHSAPVPAVMTAAGTICRQYLQSSSGQAGAADTRSLGVMKSADIILKHMPNPNVKNYYYWYYATYALLPIGGDPWKQWNPAVRDLLVGMQDKGTANPALKGSWDPKDSGPIAGSGRVGVTALALLTLEVYYRHLPLNRPELGEMAKDLSKGK
jgi:hypothetical protein